MGDIESTKVGVGWIILDIGLRTRSVEKEHTRAISREGRERPRRNGGFKHAEDGIDRLNRRFYDRRNRQYDELARDCSK